MLLASPSCVWCPPFRLFSGPVEWRGGRLCVAPVFGLGPLLHIVLAPLALSLPSSAPPFRLCVCCHSIVGLVLCFCDRVVSLWDSGDGLCWVEGRVMSIVHCQLFMCCGVWNGGGGCDGRVVLVACLLPLSPFLSLPPLSLLLVVFGVVRAQLCEHARYPRTPLCFPCCVLSLPLPAFLRASPFLLMWNGGG